MQSTIPLTLNRDFLRLYKRGRSFVSPALVMYILKNKLAINRLGITTSKKIGKAVSRNRARRVIREAYRAAEPLIQTGYDIVFVARGRTAAQKSNDLSGVIKGMIGSAGALKK